jgi:hypothetical protein
MMSSAQRMRINYLLPKHTTNPEEITRTSTLKRTNIACFLSYVDFRTPLLKKKNGYKTG